MGNNQKKIPRYVTGGNAAAMHSTGLAGNLLAERSSIQQPPSLLENTAREPVSIKTTKKYLSAVRAWPIAQSWPAPLSQEDARRC